MAVEGLVRREASPLDYPEDRFRAEAGLLDGVSLIGTGRLVDRVWTRPAISVLGIDAPSTAGAPNALIPQALAKLSMRIAPGDDPKTAFLALQAHLGRHVPWGARMTLTLEHDGSPCVIDDDRPGLRGRPGRVRRGVGRRGPGRHRGRRIDPVHRHLPGSVPGRRYPGHRRRGSRLPGARTEREPAPGRVRSGSVWPRPSCSVTWRRQCPTNSDDRRSLRSSASLYRT